MRYSERMARNCRLQSSAKQEDLQAQKTTCEKTGDQLPGGIDAQADDEIDATGRLRPTMPHVAAFRPSFRMAAERAAG